MDTIDIETDAPQRRKRAFLAAETQSAERCSSCGQWASNLDKSDPIDCIQSGDSQADPFVCIPCQTIAQERRRA